MGYGWSTGLEVRIRLTYPLPWYGTGGIGLLGWDLGLSTNGAGARNNCRMELLTLGDVAGITHVRPRIDTVHTASGLAQRKNA